MRKQNKPKFSPIYGDAADDPACRVAQGRDAAQDAEKSVGVGENVLGDALVISCSQNKHQKTSEGMEE